MNNLKITLRFNSPIIATDLIHLDAVLAYALYKHTNNLDDAHNRLPLKKTNGVYHASAFRLQSPIRCVNADFNGSIRNSDLDTALFKPNSSNGTRYLYIDTVRGEHKANLDAYLAYESLHSMGYFYAHGDKDEIEALLTTYVVGIGKKCHLGFGEITSIEIEIIQEDISLFDPQMGVMRSIPLHLLDAFNISTKAGVDTELSSYYPPYYQTKMDVCAVPNSIECDTVLGVEVDDYF